MLAWVLNLGFAAGPVDAPPVVDTDGGGSARRHGAVVVPSRPSTDIQKQPVELLAIAAVIAIMETEE